jgi:hypothetical protein
MKKGAIGLSLETMVIIAFALIILVLGLLFAVDFFSKNLIFINNTVP